eukprot:gnl/Dysnectes_brevis/5639_a8225_717.p1 GENE.gnl/Dysnectes_brevis/5639_a8225_717~~gnl/Dysnectes_brevis/5639_a8225_717.p1  ORF type:complete len:303 (-),score=13.95 gnl/Dysnectes_brevis/5639_a8225_717:39-947(-)
MGIVSFSSKTLSALHSHVCSIIDWVICQFPQIRLNFLLKSADGLSPFFLTFWYVGDLTNLISCLLTNQLFTQVILAAFWAAADTILVFQYFLYKEETVQPEGSSLEEGNTVRTSHDHSSESTSGPSSTGGCTGKYTLWEGLTYGMFFLAMAIWIYWYGRFNILRLDNNLGDFYACSVADDLPETFWTRLGEVIAFISMIFYLIGPGMQIVKNLNRRHTFGVSLGFFVLAMGGNSLSCLSMWVFSSTRDYRIGKLPYLISTAIPALMNAFVLAQTAYYKNNTRLEAEKFKSIKAADEKQVEIE